MQNLHGKSIFNKYQYETKDVRGASSGNIFCCTFTQMSVLLYWVDRLRTSEFERVIPATIKHNIFSFQDILDIILFQQNLVDSRIHAYFFFIILV